MPERSSFAITALAQTLSPDELDRAARFHSAEHHDSYVQAHAALRLLLAAYLGREPQSLDFVEESFHKPALSGHPLRFNLSHTAGLTLIAIARETPVGVDVERVRSFSDLSETAEAHFAPGEIAKLRALPAARITDAFFRCWTRKEAILKAEGSGLFRALDSFEVSLLAEEPPALLASAENPDACSHWTLLHLEPETGYVGALAYQQPSAANPTRLRKWHWDSALFL